MNKVILMGRVTKDIELKYTQQQNKAICNFNLAVDRRTKKGDHPEADFILCQAWEKTAEFITKYFSKGSKIAITGRINTRNYEDKDSKKVYVTEIIVEEAFFCESKKESQQDMPQGNIMPDTNDDDLPF